MLEAGQVGERQVDGGDVANAAGALELSGLLERGLGGADVERLAGAVEPPERPKDEPRGRVPEVLGRELGGRAGGELLVEQGGGEDRLLDLAVDERRGAHATPTLGASTRAGRSRRWC